MIKAARKVMDWLSVDTNHKTPKHIQELYIQAAKEKRTRRAKKWASTQPK